MEANEQNTQGIRDGRQEGTSIAENPGASTVQDNDNSDCHNAREEEDVLPAQPTPEQGTHREGNAAQVRESSGDGQQQPPHGTDDLGAAAPLPQEDGASATVRSSRLDDAERRRLRNMLASLNPAVQRKIENDLKLKLIALSRRKAEEAARIEALTDKLREERARGDILKAQLTVAQEQYRRLESHLTVPEREHLSESVRNLGLEGANGGDRDGAADRRRGGMSHPGRSDDADASSSSFEDGELAAGDSGGKTGSASEQVDPMAKDGKD